MFARIKKIKKQYLRAFQALLVSSVLMFYFFNLNKNLSTQIIFYFLTLFFFIFFSYYIGKNEERSKKQSLTDPLTKLDNSRYFYMCLNEEFLKLKNNKRHFSVCIMDLDKFKMINDNFGHPVGDLVLKRVSKALKNTLREGDIVARIGGEEFGIILPKCTGKNALTTIERLRLAIKREVIELSTGKKLRVTVSAGIASTDQFINLKEVKSLICKADNALYNAKNSGRNTVKVYKNRIIFLMKIRLLLKKRMLKRRKLSKAL